MFIGYHGRAGTPRSVMAHTISGGVIADARCNGRSLGELGLNTALAAHLGVPAVLVAGDDSVAAEAHPSLWWIARCSPGGGAGSGASSASRSER